MRFNVSHVFLEDISIDQANAQFDESILTIAFSPSGLPKLGAFKHGQFCHQWGFGNFRAHFRITITVLK